VGYDYGFLLTSLVRAGRLTDARPVLAATLDLLDDTGAWVEYYHDGKPLGTRYRPFESGINIEAVVEYYEHA